MREVTEPDAFTFECDLDRDQPADMRAALTVSFDGDHVVYNFSGSAGEYGREVYLTPDAARDLAELTWTLLGGRVRDPRATAGRVLALVLFVVLVVNPALAWLIR